MSQVGDSALVTRLWSEIERDDLEAVQGSLVELSQSSAWRTLARSLPKELTVSLQIKNIFHTCWTERGHHVRQDIGDDRLLAEMLRTLLPRYRGPQLMLYRGESLARWRLNYVGLCWTTDIKVARMFAGGLNAVEPHGGILLASVVPGNAIIAAPGQHSKWLGEAEYVVDSSNLTDIEEISFFPSLY